MENISFKAFVVEETDGKFERTVKAKNVEQLPQGEVLIKISYSSLNYKDALSTVGNKGVTKNYPHTPGIDASGVVVESKSPKFKPNDEVIVTSYDLGMNTSGGFAEYIRVPADWVVKLPTKLSLKEAMIYGTAGLTAAIAVHNIQTKLKPEQGKIVVSGSTGGVGIMSIMMLAKLGYQVVAITSKNDMEGFLKGIGAAEILNRETIENLDKKPILKSLYAGGIDAVGGVILENIIKSTLPLGVVLTCGNVASPNLSLTVFPFILRGVSLVGVDSQNYPLNDREMIWNKIANEYKINKLDGIYQEINLDGVSEKVDEILQGKIRGRVLIKL